ncbi:MAG: ferredoxin, partial [Methanomicrobiales archaeon]|nr:ferredoxin [Methanomicrobiales archaeon]
MATCIIRREDCTSCGSCWDLCPEYFEENSDDSRSQVMEKYRHNGNIAEGDIPADLADCVR